MTTFPILMPAITVKFGNQIQNEVKYSYFKALLNVYI